MLWIKMEATVGKVPTQMLAMIFAQRSGDRLQGAGPEPHTWIYLPSS